MKKIILTLGIVAFSILGILSCSSDDNTGTGTETGTETGTGTGTGTGTTDCNTSGILSQSTNTQIEAMRQAMLTFRSSLSSTLLAQSSNCLDSDRFITWHNTPGSRDGITYADLSEDQITKFKAVLQLFLSSEGYQKVDEITTLAEGYLQTINSGMWNVNKYAIDMFGDPDTNGSWGFQLDGHHCAINFLVHGDNVSIVPAFLAGEPVTGTLNGVSFDIFKDERDLALTLYNGFSTSEKTTAVSTGSSATMEVGPASSNGEIDPYAGSYDYSGFATGLKYSDMSADTKANLILLMKEYVYNLNTEFADKWWADITENIDDTYFVWIDNVDNPTTTTQFYYRIYNPYLWVEYNMENPVGQGLEDWNHIHTITRIPNNPATSNGGDYGIFAQVINNNDVQFLAQHYTGADHHTKSKYLFDYVLKSENTLKKKHSHKHSHGGKYHTHS